MIKTEAERVVYSINDPLRCQDKAEDIDAGWLNGILDSIKVDNDKKCKICFGFDSQPLEIKPMRLDTPLSEWNNQKMKRTYVITIEDL